MTATHRDPSAPARCAGPRGAECPCRRLPWSVFGEHPARYVAPAFQQFANQATPPGTLPLHGLPEARGMVHVPDVRELVHDQVIDDFGTLEQQAGIETDGTAHQTAAPARTLAPDLHAGVPDSSRGGQCRHPRLE